MVHVSTPRPNLGAALGQGLGQGVGQGLEQFTDRQMTKKGLDKLRNSSAQNPVDQLYNLIEASNYSPAIGRSLGPLYQTLIEQQNKNNISNVPINGGAVGSQGQAPNQGMLDQIAPQAGPNSQKFFPSNQMPKDAPGNLPQEATEGQVRPVLSGDQLIQSGEDLYKRWRQAGVTDRSLNDAIEIQKLKNDENKQYNQTLENERVRRISEQESFGEIAEEALTNLLPDATDEQKALFRKKGEEAAGGDKSQADIKRFLAKEATKFKNNISNIQKSLDAPRIQNKLQRLIQGNERTIDQALKDAKVQIDPLIKEGLYDTSRALLSKAGFYPEEREKTIFGNLPEPIRKTVKDVPKPVYEKLTKPSAPAFMGGYNTPDSERTYAPESLENLKANIKEVWGPDLKNEKANPLLLRKEYEDKGYNWRIFKDAMNDLWENGQIDFTDDQQNQFNSYINEPPMTLLEKFLYKLNLRGR